MIEDTYRIGMPETAFSSLSENWLLKTCGQRHWTLVERALGAPAAAVRDGLGRRLYASFVAMKLSDARFAEVGEDADLRIRSSGCFLTPKRTYSVHEGWRGGRRVFRQELLAVFLKRQRDGANGDLTSAAPAGLPTTPALSTSPDAERLVELARAARAALPAPTASSPGERSCVFTPTPFTEFNGAGLLYFANFQAIVDRFEFEALGPNLGASHGTRARQICIFGNLDVGDTVHGRFHDVRVRPGEVVHRLALHRGSDGRTIALASTVKHAVADLAAAAAAARPAPPELENVA